MNLTSEMKQELQKLIISAVDKEVILYEDLVFEIPSSIGDEFEISITIEPNTNEIDENYVNSMFDELRKYTTNDIADYIYEEDYQSFYDSYEDAHTSDLKQVIRREIEKNEIFGNLTVSQVNDFMNSIIIYYNLNFEEIVQYIYDEMRDMVFKEFDNTITLDDLIENDQLREWFNRYSEYMIVGEKPSDLGLFGYLEFSSIYEGLEDVFDETDTYDRLSDEIKELEETESDLSYYEIMRIMFNEHQNVFEQDDDLIKQLIDSLDLEVIKVGDYYVANTYFI